MTCPGCYSSVAEDATECPVCGIELSFRGGISVGQNFAIEKAMSGKRSEEESAAFVKKMEESDRLFSLTVAGDPGFLTAGEADGLLSRFSQAAEKEREDTLVKMIDLGIEKFEIEGIQLNTLMERAGQPNLPNILTTGIKLLKLKRYSEAAEWWVLQRSQPQVLKHSATELLYLLMELFTYRIAGRHESANHLAEEIRSHPYTTPRIPSPHAKTNPPSA